LIAQCISAYKKSNSIKSDSSGSKLINQNKAGGLTRLAIYVLASAANIFAAATNIANKTKQGKLVESSYMRCLCILSDHKTYFK